MPTEQLVQLVCAVFGLYVPAGQLVQDVAAVLGL